jgi:hypothetical protein
MVSMESLWNKRSSCQRINTDARKPSRRRLQHRSVSRPSSRLPFSLLLNPDGKKVTPQASEKEEEHDKQESENIEYVSEQLDLKGAALEAFSDVFARFQFQPEDSPVRKIHYLTPSLPHSSIR